MTEQEKKDRQSVYLCGDGYGCTIHKYGDNSFGVYSLNDNAIMHGPLFKIKSDTPTDVYTVSDRVDMAFVIAGYSNTPDDYDDGRTQEEIDEALDFNEVIKNAKDLMNNQNARDFWGVA